MGYLFFTDEISNAPSEFFDENGNRYLVLPRKKIKIINNPMDSDDFEIRLGILDKVKLSIQGSSTEGQIQSCYNMIDNLKFLVYNSKHELPYETMEISRLKKLLKEKTK